MRYYCKNCMAEFVLRETLEESAKYCPMCMRHLEKHSLVEIPDYESVKQWEKRTGEEYPEHSPVWVLCCLNIDGIWKHKWIIRAYLSKEMFFTRNLVIASNPLPPPDDWRPE